LLIEPPGGKAQRIPPNKIRKQFFFEKKNQKPSIHWSFPAGRRPSSRRAAVVSKTRLALGQKFLVLFFKKELLPSICL
jgi:hypothetical protein